MMKKNLKHLASLSVLGVLAACTNPAPKNESNGTQIPKAPGNARAFLLDGCPLDAAKGTESAFVPALLVPVVKSIASTVIDSGYDYFLETMNERQRQLTASTTFQARGDFYGPDGTVGAATENKLYTMRVACVVLVREGEGELSLSAEQKDVWDVYLGRLNGALSRSDPSYSLKNPPEFYAELKFRYIPLTVPRQTLRDEGGKVIRNARGELTVMPHDAEVPVEFEVKTHRVFYGKSGASINSTDSKRLTISIDLTARVFEDQKWNSIPLLSNTFDMGAAKIGEFIPEADLRKKDGATAPLRPPGEMIVQLPYAGQKVYGLVPDLLNVTMTAVLTESEDGSDIERWLFQQAKQHRNDVTDKAKSLANEGIDRLKIAE